MSMHSTSRAYTYIRLLINFFSSLFTMRRCGPENCTGTFGSWRYHERFLGNGTYELRVNATQTEVPFPRMKDDGCIY